MLRRPYDPESSMPSVFAKQIVAPPEPAVQIAQWDYSVPLPATTGLDIPPFQAPAGATMVVIEAVGGGGGGMDGNHQGNGRPGAGGAGCKMAETTFDIKAGAVFVIKLGQGGPRVPLASGVSGTGQTTSVSYANNETFYAPGADGGDRYPQNSATSYPAGQPGGNKDQGSYSGTPSDTGFNGGGGGWASGGGASDFGDGAAGGRAWSHNLGAFPALYAGPGAGGGGGLCWDPDPGYPGSMVGGPGGNGFVRLTFFSV